MTFWLHLGAATFQLLAGSTFLHAYGITTRPVYSLFAVWAFAFAGWHLVSAWKLRRS